MNIWPRPFHLNSPHSFCLYKYKLDGLFWKTSPNPHCSGCVGDPGTVTTWSLNINLTLRVNPRLCLPAACSLAELNSDRDTADYIMRLESLFLDDHLEGFQRRCCGMIPEQSQGKENDNKWDLNKIWFVICDAARLMQVCLQSEAQTWWTSHPPRIARKGLWGFSRAMAK